jgi:hypothetical protein
MVTLALILQDARTRRSATQFNQIRNFCCTTIDVPSCGSAIPVHFGGWFYLECWTKYAMRNSQPLGCLNTHHT